MGSERVDEALLVQYLLGNLSEPEEVQVEDRAFADADYLGALESVEADLIDSYVRGGLSQSERRAFERRFLTSPSRWSKVEFARALARVASESREREQPAGSTIVHFIRGWSPALRFAAGLAALICLAGPSWLAFQNAALRSRIAVLQEQHRQLEIRERGIRRQLGEEQTRAGALAQRQEPQSTGAAALVASLILLPGISRAQMQVEQLVLPPSAQIARIEVQLEARDDYRQFRVELRTRRGEEVLTRSNLPRHRTISGYAVSFDVPTSALPAGEYELALKGVANPQALADIGYYYFGVRKQ